MKKDILYILATLILASCMSGQKVIFNHYESENGNQRKVKYYMNVPQNYRLESFQADAEVGAEQQYWYSDSIVIYITSMEGLPSINQENIKNQDGAAQKRFSAFINNDTLTLKGKNEKGLLWKDIKLKNISIGYANVPPEKETTFDLVLKSISKK
jgi:hypothetical protein